MTTARRSNTAYPADNYTLEDEVRRGGCSKPPRYSAAVCLIVLLQYSKAPEAAVSTVCSTRELTMEVVGYHLRLAACFCTTACRENQATEMPRCFTLQFCALVAS